MEFTRAEVCVTAASDTWRDAGEVLAHAVGTVPAAGARLARLTHSPDLVLSDGEAFLMSELPPLGQTAAAGGVIEAWLPYRRVFDVLQTGRRQSMMGASQLDRYGNQNISAIGDWRRPSRQLIGVRGAPGNTVNHRTDYWVPNHSTRVFVESVDVVSGVGNDRARTGGPAARRFHRLGVVVTDLAVLDYGPDGRLRIRSVHPGVTVRQVQECTGFPLDGTGAGETRAPTAEELRLIREVVDPGSLRSREVPG
ncbi:acyl CoA:acetate/3-ketoacid CoA transferase beta subunit [Streptosporangium becharense]|uniref:Acyl CoA:acetate/3-ketoacid CoA transferase beta subunit n=1 Tax=Streptosporangium becharense TaxID=1816182 RepID=A0A7W9MEF0_9ACTN|nr:CoA-transferase [Streptosporangium becharense]MBB2910696.1 acyl CoA:acetate/3-ketoacid CoA transferase beta subunit [Streptosporangium becharense]MBB5817391.1 acyl CoA:acetate/3-ketoacid CoA transferase beta subunit [Streptosporangium becharense]